MVTTSHPAAGGIVLSCLSKSYGQLPAVDGIDLTIAAGETVALLGPNGAGKSTTIDMLLGLTRPDSGQILVFGMSPSEAVAEGVVGGMLQTGTVIEYLTVHELVTMVASLYPHPLEVDEVLDLTGTAEFARRRTTKLSGGQMQRVRVAVALVGNPDFLLFDEPTTALDVEGRRDFWATTALAASGKTVVFATHYLEEADVYADRIVLIARGRIVADGPANQIKTMVGARTIRATLPSARLDELVTLPGVATANRRGESVILQSDQVEVTLRELLNRFPKARHVEVQGADIEAAFLTLTADPDADRSFTRAREVR